MRQPSQTVFPAPPMDLEEPGTFIFTAARALSGRALNRFALSLRTPAARHAFLADPIAYQASFGLDAAEMGMVADRDWTGLLRSGGHLQAMLKLAVTVGDDLWHIGAHSVGCTRDTLFEIGPRPVRGVPSSGEP